MRVSYLLKDLECKIIGSDHEIKGLSYDSSLVKKDDLFFAIKGYKVDGHDYIDDAIANGATAIVVEELQNVCQNITQIVVSDTRYAMGEISARFHDFPAKKLRVLGVTGTNGKTTTTYLLKAILEEAGYRVGLIGTIQIMITDTIIPASRTTPESVDLQSILAKMVQEKVDYVVMEVSSHALELDRTVGIDFDQAIYTNLTQDHLDFHHDFRNYFKAKAKLFSNLAHPALSNGLKAAIINFDDSYGLQIAARSSAPVYSYGIDQHTQICACDLEVGNKGVSYRLVSPFGEAQLSLNLTGKFNVYNSMAASTACLAEGISLSIIKAGLEGVQGVAGRFELVDYGQDFAVIVDYAHTPDSLANVLETAKSFATNRVIAVFGAGGDRDKSKRSLMGQVAAKHADLIILTSDNPRSEQPEEICKDIERGVLTNNQSNIEYEIEVDRRKAIYRAIEYAEPGDVIIIAGKGHETYQQFEDYTVDFNDRAEALQALKELVL